MRHFIRIIVTLLLLVAVCTPCATAKLAPSRQMAIKKLWNSTLNRLLSSYPYLSKLYPDTVVVSSADALSYSQGATGLNATTGKVLWGPYLSQETIVLHPWAKQFLTFSLQQGELYGNAITSGKQEVSIPSAIYQPADFNIGTIIPPLLSDYMNHPLYWLSTVNYVEGKGNSGYVALQIVDGNTGKQLESINFGTNNFTGNIGFYAASSKSLFIVNYTDFTSNIGQVYALDIRTQAVNWIAPIIKNDVFYTFVTSDEKRVLIVTYDTVTAIRNVDDTKGRKGTVAWTHSLEWDGLAILLSRLDYSDLTDDVFVYGMQTVLALRASDGEVLWHNNKSATLTVMCTTSGNSSPRSKDHRGKLSDAYLVTTAQGDRGGQLQAFSLATGDLVASHQSEYTDSLHLGCSNAEPSEFFLSHSILVNGRTKTTTDTACGKGYSACTKIHKYKIA